MTDMAGKGCKWMDLLEMTGNGTTLLELLEMARMSIYCNKKKAINDKKQLKWLDMAGNV